MKVMILLSKHYEETEALTVVDYLRRADITIDMVATEGNLQTVGAHNIVILADKLIQDVNAKDYEMIITPGGVGGTEALMANKEVVHLFKKQFQSDRYLASICASPLVLGKAEISEHIRGTIYPGFEKKLSFKEYISDEPVVVDREHQVITSQGPATAVYFALTLIEVLKGKEVRDQVAKGLLLPQLEDFIKA